MSIILAFVDLAVLIVLFVLGALFYKTYTEEKHYAANAISFGVIVFLIVYFLIKLNFS